MIYGGLMISKKSNFREIAIGKITPKTLYRSDHPLWNGKQVKSIVLAASKAKIKTIINLSDSVKSLEAKILSCPWYNSIFRENNVIALNMSMKFDFLSARTTEKIRHAISFMVKRDPPYLIHCKAGIDRTGFLSIMLESFMGAQFDDIVKDYMRSFVGDDEYSKDDYRSGAIIIANIFTKIKGSLFDKNDDLQKLSKKYLLEKVKLTHEDLMLLKNRLYGII
jgi:protein tyrosine/serine phosphatase